MGMADQGFTAIFISGGILGFVLGFILALAAANL